MATTLETFQLFPLLPVDIRDLIWQEALPKNRICQVEVVELPHILEDEEDDRFEEEEDELLWRELCFSGEEKEGEDMEDKDIEYCPEKDVRLLVHRAGKSREGSVVMQAQLEKYGFQTSRPLPEIHHICPHGDFHGEIPGEIECKTPFPPLLHACRESRGLAIRSGYALKFATRWAPGQKWVNFHTDYLVLDRSDAFELPSYLPDIERQQVRRLAMRCTDLSPSDVASGLIYAYRNLEELALIVSDFRGGSSNDLRLVDCSIAETLEESDRWLFKDMFLLAVACHKYHPGDVLFYEYIREEIKIYMTQELELLDQRRLPKPMVPRIRIVHLTDAEGERDLETLRGRYRSQIEACSAEKE